MKKTLTLIAVVLTFQSAKSYTLSDSLNTFTEKEILKLSTLIYELEKLDSVASANEPNGFNLKDRNSISDATLLVDLDKDSIHDYTGLEVIKLSNYIFELERRDSIRKALESAPKEIVSKPIIDTVSSPKEVAEIVKPAEVKKEDKSESVFYSVQIGAYRRNPRVNGVKEFHVLKFENGINKYLSGEFKTLTEAEERKSELIKKGFKEAYIVIFRDGKPVN